MPTVSLNVKYIILNPDRLFKTVHNLIRCSKMLRRYVSYRSPRPYYVLYIINRQSYLFMQNRQKLCYLSRIY